MTLVTEPRLDLRRLGWEDLRVAEIATHGAAGLVPGRVAAQLRGAYTILTGFGEAPAELAGRLQHEADGPQDLPAVGDWVAVDRTANRAVIRAVLPRRSAIARKAAGRGAVEQVLAANVDVVLVVISLEGEQNARRLERYLSVAWESGGQPVVVLTKADLRSDAEAVAAEVAATAFAPVHAISARSGAGVDDLRAYLAGDRTLALVGPSGAGKSTLVNRLLGSERQSTRDLRKDGKGRHTTTHRELFLVPGGGVVVDTPGLKELGLWSGDRMGTDEAFADIAELAAACRFNDCAHETEPGCAVLAAIVVGGLDPDRLESYRKLMRERAWVARRQDGRATADARRARRRMARSMKGPAEGPWTS